MSCSALVVAERNAQVVSEAQRLGLIALEPQHGSWALVFWPATGECSSWPPLDDRLAAVGEVGQRVGAQRLPAARACSTRSLVSSSRQLIASEAAAELEARERQLCRELAEREAAERRPPADAVARALRGP